MVKNVARRAYSAEQLLALRHSASDEPAVQIETNAENSAIKDHVVRNARSFAARSSRSLATSESMRPPSTDHRQSSAPVLGEIDPNNQALRPLLNLSRHRPSPSPSLKKRKAEQILKDHGSPPGLRVTAGGRIVPSDQSPLCSPRYGYSAIKKNGMLIKFGPNYPPPLSAIALQKIQGLPNGFIAQDPNGRLCQMVNGQFLPVSDINGIPQLYIAAPNFNGFPLGDVEDPAVNTPFDNAIRKQASQGREGSFTGPPIEQAAMQQPTVSVTMQIQALEKQYTKLEQESRDLDKVEVLQRSSMGPKAYSQLIQKRRELVGRLNEIRISLKALRDAKSSAEPSSGQGEQRPMQPQFGMPPFPGHPMMAAGPPLPDWSFDGISHEARGNAPFPGAPPHPELGFFVPPGAFPGPVPPYPGMFGPVPPMYNMMGMPPIDAFNGYMPNASNTNPQAFSNGSPPGPRPEPMPEGDSNNRRATNDTGSAEKDSPRRIHALEIKDPGHRSALNPMSPSYQPAPSNGKKSTPVSKATQAFAGSPSPALAEAVRAHNAWVGDSANASNSAGSRRGVRYDSSASSYATADFFPNNPRDHSMKKDAYPVSENRSTDRFKFKEERRTASNNRPVTPEKEHHHPDWNSTIPDAAFEDVITPPTEQQAVMAPPGTPENGKADPVSNRSEINVSPKSRRPDYLMNFTSVTDVANMSSGVAAPATGHSRQTQQTVPSGSSRHGFDHEATAYMQGFKAGEARMPIGPERTGLWLDGYCAGLMKSNHSSNASSSSKQKSDSRIRQGNTSQAPQKNQGQKRTVPELDVKASSIDTLKEAVFSAQNENAVLTPDPSAPGVSGMSAPTDLGGCAKTHDAAPSTVPDAILAQIRNGEGGFPERTFSMVQRQLSGPGLNLVTEQGRAPAVPPKARQIMMEPELSQISQDRRTTSSQSQPGGNSPSSYFQRAYPGHRVLSSQLEWKSGSSIAQVAGLATGYFAQYDGTRHDTGTLGDKRPLTQVSGNAGMTTQDVPGRVMPEKHVVNSPRTQARFVEASMATDEQTGSSPLSPGKKSPAKVKFAQIAGKAGIKVRSDNKEENEGEAMSPNEKRRWRDVWKKRFTEGREGDYEQSGRH